MPPDYGFRRYWRALWGWNPWRIGSASVLLAAAALTDGFALLMLVPLLAMAGIAAGHGGELNWLSGTFRTMRDLPSVAWHPDGGPRPSPCPTVPGVSLVGRSGGRGRLPCALEDDAQ